MTLVKHFGFNS